MKFKCPNCDATATTAKALRQHAYVKHAEPTPFTLPDGSVERVIATDHGTYACWCGVERSSRETITTHVQKEHVQDASIKITLFRSKTGKSFNRISAGHYLRSHSGPPTGEAIEATSEDSPGPALVPPPVAPQPAPAQPAANPPKNKMQDPVAMGKSVEPMHVPDITHASGAQPAPPRAPLLPPRPAPDAPHRGRLPSTGSFSRLKEICKAATKIPAAIAAANTARISRKDGTPLYRRLPPAVKLDAREDYFVSYPCLDAVGVIFHHGLRLAKCLHCSSYLTIDHIKGHMKDQHHIRLSPAELDLATQFLIDCKVHRTPKDVHPPAPNGPPVQDLAVLTGYACEESDCVYACVDLDTITKHQRQVHEVAYLGESRPQVSVQTLFRTPRRYFRVNPTLSTVESPDVVSALSDTFMAKARQPPPRLTAERDGDSTPFHQLMGFDDLLLSIRQDRDSSQQLASLKKRHTAEEDGGIYQRLADVASEWAASGPDMMKGNIVQLDLTRVIIYGPAQVPHQV
ncbi:hypothetical protein HWV62_1943 [Athelia sp. TMB]|nr:hypothetical protein HWV62_1943 [Athelia sp. TMB]